MSNTKKNVYKKTTKVEAKLQSTPSAAHKHPKPGLGRGLGALISHHHTPQKAGVTVPAQHPSVFVPPATTPSGVSSHLEASALPEGISSSHDNRRTVFDLPVAEIARSPWQPRQTFDEAALHELCESIKANGVIQPLICRKNTEGRYELIAGERRLRAAVEAKLSKVPVILVDAEDRRAAEMAIIENIQRQDLNVIEEAEGYRTLAETFNLTQQDVADRVGKARASVANTVRLLELPDEVKQLVGSGLLSTGHAKVLLGLGSATEQTILGRKCVTEDLTVRTLEKIIRRRKTENTAGADLRRTGKPDLPESYVRDLMDRLHKHFGTAVRLSPGMTHANGKRTKGVLEIDFYDNEDLDRVLSVLGIKLD
ncbi:MAG: ParB/RepB/Spo0J family partition protein [Kiritimatiellae bacterium]|nr:ParB/RepB/Spo0J family partition protein [Kiritimatiellia bacterium]